MNGVHDWDFNTYVRQPGVNWHTLEPFRKSPLHGVHAKRYAEPPSDEMMLGTLFDVILLTPEKLSEYVAMPKFEGHPNSNIHKAAKESWLAENSNKKIVPIGDLEKAGEMLRSLGRHPFASAIVEADGKNQFGITWEDTITRRGCKGLVDMFRVVDSKLLWPDRESCEIDLVVDVKTTRAISPDGFAREVDKYGYHGQIAFYCEGMKQCFGREHHAAWIAVENSPPFDVAVYILDPDSLEAGSRLWRRLLNQYDACEKTNHWPGVAERPIELSLPRYSRDLE